MVRVAATILFSALERIKTPRVALAELTECLQYGFTARAIAEPVGPKFIRITDLQDGKVNWQSVPFCNCDSQEKYMLRDNDILFARTGATTGKTYLVSQPPPSVFASYLIRLHPKPEVTAGYLYAFSQSDDYWSQIISEKEGSAQPNVNGQKLSSLMIPLVSAQLQQAIANFIERVRSRQDGASEDLPELPSPLAEQRTIVAKIEELAAQIHEAHTLRQKSEIEIQQMLLGAFSSIADKSPRMLMGEVAPLIRRSVQVDPLGVYPELGIRSFGKGTFHKPALSGLDVGGKRLFQIEPGDLLFNNVFAWEGAIAVAKSQDGGRFGSHRFITCAPKSGLATSQFLCFYFLTKEGLERIGEASPGGAGRNRTLGLETLARIEVPVPAISEQKWFHCLMIEVERLRFLQAETTAEFDALLPSILDRAFKGEL
jgi:type I restriction enzyme S subunit